MICPYLQDRNPDTLKKTPWRRIRMEVNTLEAVAAKQI